MTGGWDRARTIADAVLYEGYLLYPYRANSRKNQTRWQFGVLGPAGAADAGIGEDDSLSAQVLVAPQGKPDGVDRGALPAVAAPGRREGRGGGRFEPVEELASGSQSWLRWDEAVEREISFGPIDIESGLPQTLPIESTRAPTSRRSTAAGWSAPVVRCTHNWRSRPNATTGSCA